MGMNSFRSLLFVLIGISAVVHPLALAQERTPPENLVQYVRSAKKEGLVDSQAQQLAIRAGWPPAAVTDAVAEVYGAVKQPAADASKGADLPPTATQPSASQANTPAQIRPNARRRGRERQDPQGAEFRRAV